MKQSDMQTYLDSRKNPDCQPNILTKAAGIYNYRKRVHRVLSFGHVNFSFSAGIWDYR